MKCHSLFSFAFLVFLSCSFIQPTFGQTWKRIKTPAYANFGYNVVVLPNGLLAIDALNGVWVTPDQGRTWNFTLNVANVFRIRSTNVLYAVGGAASGPFIYVSDNTGNNWVNIAKTAIERPFVTQIAVRNTEDIFALGTKFLGANPWLYRTTNGGAIWNSTSSEEPQDFFYLLAGPENLLFGLERTSGFYRSNDNGATWSNINNGLAGSLLTSLIKDGEGNLFVTSSEGRLFRSNDQGLSWQSSTSAFADSVTLESLNISPSGEMFVVGHTPSQYAINWSSDGGVSWNQIGEAISWGSVRSIAITPRETIVVLVDNDLYTNDETFLITSVRSEDEGVTSGFELEQNYPNPFNPNTKLRFTLSRPSFVTLKVHNTLGEEIANLVSKNLDAGRHEVEWNASKFTSGVYLYRLQAGDFVETKKLTILK